ILDVRPCILLDATPSRAIDALIEANGGKIVRAIAQQNLNIVHYHQYLHGRTWKNPEHQRAEFMRLLTMQQKMQEETGEKPCVLTHKALYDMLEEPDPDWGYFGRDDIGQDRWGGRNLLIFGGPILGPSTLASRYNGEAMLLRLVGIDVPDWNPEVEREQEVTVGDKIVVSRAPLPKDPFLRDWVLDDYGRRMAQAIGRVRAVSAETPRTVWVVGGMPLAGLARHGIRVSEYRQEKTFDLRHHAHQEAIKKLQVAVATIEAGDEDATYRRVSRWLADHGLPGVRYQTWKDFILSTRQEREKIRSADELLESLNALQTMAEFAGVDISDIALRVLKSTLAPPLQRVAAEIVLHSSPYTDHWRHPPPPS
ncbi:MAG: hypothetical protein OWQ56_08275, partial [Acidithiobacillus caldus]|nr:hypothetical protein [Acidithiobacillus caldus]